MVSGAAGSIVVVLMSLAAQHGMGYVLWATIFAGIIQILIGVFRLGKFIRLVPLPPYTVLLTAWRLSSCWHNCI